MLSPLSTIISRWRIDSSHSVSFSPNVSSKSVLKSPRILFLNLEITCKRLTIHQYSLSTKFCGFRKNFKIKIRTYIRPLVFDTLRHIENRAEVLILIRLISQLSRSAKLHQKNTMSDIVMFLLLGPLFPNLRIFKALIFSKSTNMDALD